MADLTIHNIEKVEIQKYWLDTGTFVVKFTIYDFKEKRDEIILFSKRSEPFTDIEANINSI